MSLPKISIVTPSFNQGEYIEQTICSVLDQGYSNLEYIIIDGGSTDDTISIIKKYAKHLSYWMSEGDKGQTDAINKGFARCTGDVFNWLNSDDYYEPGTFKNLAAYFSNKDTDVVCGKEWGFVDGEPEAKRAHAGSVVCKDVCQTIRAGIIDQPCTFFRREKIEALFPLHTSLRYVMDRQLWWSYLLQYGQKNIRQVNDVFTHFRLHPTSKSVSEEANFEEEFELLKESLLSQLDAPPDLLQELKTTNNKLSISWPVQHGQREGLLAAFASFYAGRKYVKKDRPALQNLTELVRGWKGQRMNLTEWKWWLVAHALPERAFNYLKHRASL